ncbi:ergothioneine biosynthesis protein EgtC [Gloeobacter morelensis]|uniref:Ergothioneine biosynthesis protein EgtC n=1 Tax=Gloeobacter morelensis MG652769 TaxID=2781736 RepID=A0ABY3PK02_9CYAN|nr:ergothioneine biosynthesis protein EgtC [Gloeobacter morelensis]UFP93949.1 ergothioneine biosynthesis protein EgtC [Gloeobacter morelensis MG652769]
MCRLLAYQGPPVALAELIEKPEHSLCVQSYQPREMTSGLLNADGFGFGWYDPARDGLPFRFRSIQPIWTDANLGSLGRYVRAGCILANVRSATPGLAVDLSNCQPFAFERILGLHNGFIQNFRQTLYRSIRDSLDDPYYKAIDGSTDSEHIFAFVLNTWDRRGGSLEEALAESIRTLALWAAKASVSVSLNLIFADGERLVASRYANRPEVPTLYWLGNDLAFPAATIVASEPLFASEQWQSLAPGSILIVEADSTVRAQSIEMS